MDFLEFVKQRKIEKLNEAILNEGFSQKNFKDALTLIVSLLKKNIKGTVLAAKNTEDLTIDGTKCKSYLILVASKKGKGIDRGFSINFAVNAKSMDPYSVTFYDDDDIQDLYWDKDDDAITTYASLNVNLNGNSIVYYLPLIYQVMNTGDFSLDADKAKKIANKVFDKDVKETVYDYYIGAQVYKIIEGRSEKLCLENFITKCEISSKNYHDKIMENGLEDKKKEVYDKLKQSRIDGDKELEKQLYKEYRQILNAIKGGSTLGELDANVSRKVKVVRNEDESTREAAVKFEKERKDPNQAFKEMTAYVKSVIKGLQPGCILCGAPGIGKTYRVLRQLKVAGYTNGQNLDIIKGKCTPRQMYLTMYEHKDPGQIIVIDDADSLVGPKAPEDIINILKGALDSTTDDDGGRIVSYRVSGDLKDDEGVPVPKTMSFKGSVIVITNYAVGQLDTALRGRVFTQSLDFTTEQLLQIIKEIMPNIDPVHLKPKAKIKAYEYLNELAEKGSSMEISIRTFGTCARLFQICEDDPDLGDETAKSMIKEQLENMTMRASDGKARWNK